MPFEGQNRSTGKTQDIKLRQFHNRSVPWDHQGQHPKPVVHTRICVFCGTQTRELGSYVLLKNFIDLFPKEHNKSKTTAGSLMSSCFSNCFSVKDRTAPTESTMMSERKRGLLFSGCAAPLLGTGGAWVLGRRQPPTSSLHSIRWKLLGSLET